MSLKAGMMNSRCNIQLNDGFGGVQGGFNFLRIAVLIRQSQILFVRLFGSLARTSGASGFDCILGPHHMW